MSRRRIKKKIKNDPGAVCFNLGQKSGNVAQYQEAVEHYQAALHTRREDGMQKEEAEVVCLPPPTLFLATFRGMPTANAEG